MANLLLPFGTDTGGMQVRVIGTENGHDTERRWSLVAQSGDGPYIPAVVARAAIANRASIPSGARPCLAELPLATLEAAMADLDTSTHRAQTPASPLFAHVLGKQWQALAPQAQALHRVYDLESFSGTARITRGTHPVARLVAKVFGFPQAGTDMPVVVTKTRTPQGEIWTRDFSGQIFRSHCSPAPQDHSIYERFGPITCRLDLSVDNGAMQLPVAKGWFLGIPIPRFLLPRSDSQERVENGVFIFDVAISLPLSLGLIVHYQGHLKPDACTRPAP